MDLKLNNNYQENNYKKETEGDQQDTSIVNKTGSNNSIIGQKNNNILEPVVDNKTLGLGNIIDKTGLNHSVSMQDYQNLSNSNRINQQNNYTPKFTNGLGNIRYITPGSENYKILGGVDII